MRAVDTNVVVRLIVADDPVQTPLAERELVEGFFVSHGVWMEVEWVLRSFYKLDREQIAAALLQLMNHSNVHVSEPDTLRWAVDRYVQGADFPDMLHLIAAIPYCEFASFEKHLGRQAGQSAPVCVVHLQ